mmetsp:Transcript_28137/g.82688  ORF Transcript_28137/g.82688 Transcript_28137/m.82688 type:complete len:267 (-) Transcript_28137:179-979(-)|eukprot:CAMPEP_0206041706 /NCGR_PEP_ID=MMETSP1466-20131121/6118_1 /ASSEMBLY_ACC=CAM_ASM_001126 /TAXON_ID=44452 /ORGANISM="Pavlova gyrans, Strain CCMP608" /LENGTH=266 /DNA_ID=CAMNT_0053416409 /DNA_START=54 /DNA_END=854 /DNA_ORIENTATION=+
MSPVALIAVASTLAAQGWSAVGSSRIHGGAIVTYHPHACSRRRLGPFLVMDDSSSDPDGRTSIKVTAPREVLSKLATQCRMEAGFKRGLTGVVYGLGEDRLEIVAEGKRLDKFVEWVQQFLDSQCEETDEACDVNVGGGTIISKSLEPSQIMYSSDFPLVNFDNVDRRIVMILKGSKQVLDYTLRHTKIEANFNRKLQYTSKWLDDQHLELNVQGPARQLKSFVRWCKRGPPLQKPDSVTMHWVDGPPLEDAKPIATAFTDEGVGV